MTSGMRRRPRSGGHSREHPAAPQRAWPSTTPAARARPPDPHRPGAGRRPARAPPPAASASSPRLAEEHGAGDVVAARAARRCGPRTAPRPSRGTPPASHSWAAMLRLCSTTTSVTPLSCRRRTISSSSPTTTGASPSESSSMHSTSGRAAAPWPARAAAARRRRAGPPAGRAARPGAGTWRAPRVRALARPAPGCLRMPRRLHLEVLLDGHVGEHAAPAGDEHQALAGQPLGRRRR